MTPPRTAAALLAVAALAGCGTSDEQTVRDTLARFQTATAKKDYGALCKDVLARDLVSRLQAIGLPCELALRKSLGGVSRPALKIEKVRVRGDTALANIVTTAAGQRPSRDTIRLVRQGDDWRISALSGAQPPAPPRDLAGQAETGH
ncbi:MAG: hypothetical protein QOJ97_408 [Solirubrobacteraceae bacterium]|jgi:hypothetical protein|nr:hypothetical protein [Solirubrobacteraceae bacterium]